MTLLLYDMKILRDLTHTRNKGLSSCTVMYWAVWCDFSSSCSSLGTSTSEPFRLLATSRRLQQSSFICKLYSLFHYIAYYRDHVEGKVLKYGKHYKWENSYQKMRRSPEERHTQTHRSLIETFLVITDVFFYQKRINVGMYVQLLSSDQERHL